MICQKDRARFLLDIIADKLSETACWFIDLIKDYAVVRFWSWKKLWEQWNHITEQNNQESSPPTVQRPFHVHISSRHFMVHRGRYHSAETVFETPKEYIATLNSAVSKYRLVIVISEHLAQKDKYRTRDGYLNLDPSCSGRFPTYNILIGLPITRLNSGIFWSFDLI